MVNTIDCCLEGNYFIIKAEVLSVLCYIVFIQEIDLVASNHNI